MLVVTRSNMKRLKTLICLVFVSRIASKCSSSLADFEIFIVGNGKF